MLTIHAKEKETIDQMLKRYKKKTKSVKLIKEIRSRMGYKKPSRRRREQLVKAIYTERYRRMHE